MNFIWVEGNLTSKKEIDKEKEKQAKQELYYKEAHYGSSRTSDYSSKHKLRERMESLLKLDKTGICLYCESKVASEENLTDTCNYLVRSLVRSVTYSLPLGVENKNVPIYSEKRRLVTRFSKDLAGNLSKSERWETKKEKSYYRESVKLFRVAHFPGLQGVICEDCKKEFLEKSSKIFNPIIKRNLKKKKLSIPQLNEIMINCHEDYMKLFESFIEKRGF